MALASAGAELMPGTMDDFSQLRQAMEGIDTVFAVTTPFEEGMEAEVRQGRNVADAAKAAGLPLVFTSVAWAWAKTGIPHFESKWQVEEHIRAIDVPHTILGPVFFMENTIASWSLDPLRKGVLAIPITPQASQAMIAIQNIAEIAVLAIEQPERMSGRRIDIAGDALTGEDAARLIAEASGHEIHYFAVPIEAVRADSEDLAIMFEYYENKRPFVDIAALRADYPEVNWLTFEQWAGMQNWAALLASGAAGAT
jgi:uncharacterized protein YbjT (DUF2867 family)